jgi:ribosomal protein S1
MRSVTKLTLAGLLAFGLAASLPSASAQDAAAFSGKVSSVDKSAQTVVINNQTYHLLPTSRITKNQLPATASDLAVGEQVSGQFKNSAENQMEVLTLDIAQATGGTIGTGTAESGASFSGRVTKVDPSAKTVMVGGQTYQVLATSKIMRDNKPASLNEIKPGQQVAGVYKTSAENKMEVLTMDVGGRGAAVGGTGDTTTGSTGATVSGKVTKVDPVTQTVTIGNRTFHVLPTTTITTTDGSAATLGNVQANQTVSGTYKKATTGNLELLTLKVGK